MEKLIKLSQLIFPDLTDEDTIESLEALMPERGLKEGAKVTRMAPSLTGSMHIGNLYGAFVDERLAHQSGGVFFLRIEDTDDKREVPGAVEAIIKYMGAFGIEFDEGASADGDIGTYGPYRQRSRAKFYHIVAKKLLLENGAVVAKQVAENYKELLADDNGDDAVIGGWNRFNHTKKA